MVHVRIQQLARSAPPRCPRNASSCDRCRNRDLRRLDDCPRLAAQAHDSGEPHIHRRQRAQFLPEFAPRSSPVPTRRPPNKALNRTWQRLGCFAGGRIARGLVVRMPSIGGAENAACFSYSYSLQGHSCGRNTQDRTRQCDQVLQAGHRVAGDGASGSITFLSTAERASPRRLSGLLSRPRSGRHVGRAPTRPCRLPSVGARGHGERSPWWPARPGARWH